jgi:glutamate/aspartate transport system ATP-binding protein
LSHSRKADFVDGQVHDPKTDLLQAALARGMVFQNFELFLHLSVTENLTLAQMKDARRKPEEAKTHGLKMDRVGLMAHKTSSFGQLSGGQQQRVAIARALSMDPIAKNLTSPPPRWTRRWSARCWTA